jgi:5,10-methylenetetrahydromethanopterin reductase
MNIGINGTGLVQSASVQRVIDHALQAERDGFKSYWLAEHPTGGFDAMTVLALVGQAVQEMELGTAVIPLQPRHPIALAGQALTTANAMKTRFTLGVGLSHEIMMAQLGIGFEKPIRQLKESLNLLVPLLEAGEVRASGEMLSGDAQFFGGKPAKSIQVVVAALGPQALGVAGRQSAGTTLAWVGPKTVREHIVPRLSDAAASAGRGAPRVIATLPVCVTDDEETVRAAIGRGLKMYATLPSYQAMFEKEGVAGPGELAIVGSRAQCEDRIQAMLEAGVTDFAASEYYLNPEEKALTRSLLKHMAAPQH